jgi:hypothetical protein
MCLCPAQKADHKGEGAAFMNWKIIPALIYISFLNIAVSCIDDLFASSNTEEKAAVVCSDSVKFDSMSREALQEIFLGRRTTWDEGGGIILAILKEGKAHARIP